MCRWLRSLKVERLLTLPSHLWGQPLGVPAAPSARPKAGLSPGGAQAPLQAGLQMSQDVSPESHALHYGGN